MQEAEIRARVNDRGWGPFFNKLWVASGLGWMSDAMNIAALGLVLPAIISDLDLTRSEAGMIVSATFVGFMVGAILTGRLADIIGRRTLLIGNIVLFSGAAVLAGFSQGFWMLVVLRFVQGVGMGGEFPIIGTYLNELSPARYRGRLVALTSAFYAYAFALIPLIGTFVVPVLGWRGLFFVLVVPVVFAVWARRNLPESPVFLARRGRSEEAAAALRVIEDGTTHKPTSDKATRDDHGGGLVTMRTAVLAVMWVLIFFAQYGFASWIPSAVSEAMGTNSSSYLLTSLLFSGMVIGYLGSTYVASRLSERAFLLFAFVEFGVSLVLFGAFDNIVAMVAFGWLAGAGYGFTTTAAYAYTPRQFATRVRGSGFGLVTGVGRIGAIAGPMVVAFLDPVGSLGASFVAFGLASLLVILIVLGLERRRRHAQATTVEGATA
jgi:putative MFS transporter